MKLAFLVGSGISIDAGMPCVADVSDQVFSGRNAVRHSDATYYIVADAAVPAYDAHRPELDAAVALTNRFREMADEYFAVCSPDHRPNYEDVANLAKQVGDAISGEYENAALSPLLAGLRKELGADAQDLMERAVEAHNYIQDMVWGLLSRPVTGVAHLRAITDACGALGRVDLFDLNHDVVLERALTDHGVSVSDGFGAADGDVRWWDDCFNEPVRHFKLHGSIRWFRRARPTQEWRGSVVARSTTNDPDHERSASGELLDAPVDGRPAILVGTFDKPLAYDTSVHADQHFHFYKSLRRAERLVVVGYGFADKGVNNRVIGWLGKSRDHRLVVVHGDEEALLAGARPAIKSKWFRWREEGRLRVLPRWVADATWDEIQAACA